ncbi:MAG: redox-regulated ATPase YchF [Clostridia bacterium]
MKLGVVGLPNVGKSTLFNAITKAGAESANYPFCTIEPNVGIVDVPDERLNKLAKLYDSKKITPTQIEFVDIAGLVKGASRGEGLGNKFLSHIREVDAIVHVVRCFEDSNITHVEGNVDPIRDMETINLELIFADLESIQRRYEKAQSLKKVGDKKNADNVEVLEKICKCLESGKPVRSLAFEDDDAEFVKGLFLLTAKPVIYVANIKEEEILDGENLPMVLKLKQEAKVENAEVCVISAKIEEDLSLLPQDEREMFLSEYNLTESGLNKLVKSCYKLLGLISYLTAGEKETRAWTIERGTKAPQAAGKIHTDFEKGFIRAEVIDYEVLLEYGSYNACKEKGKVRSEGKEYVIKDGDVVLFRFNV